MAAEASILSQRARLGGLKTAATRDPKQYTARARETFRASFLEAVDPHGTLEEAERERRAEAARKLHYAKLALRSALVRRARKKRAASPKAATPTAEFGNTDRPSEPTTASDFES